MYVLIVRISRFYLKINNYWFIDILALKCVNELSVGAHAWLVQQPKSSVNLYYISGEQCNTANLPTILELMLISETDPSDRFKKLVAKGHLEDAEVK